MAPLQPRFSVSHGAFVREREVKISTTSGRIKDATLSLHVLARHDNNIGSSLHHPAPQQRRKNFLLPKPDRMVIQRHCGGRARTVSVDSMCGCFLFSVKQFWWCYTITAADNAFKDIWSWGSLQRAQAESGMHSLRHLKVLYLVAQDAFRVVDRHGSGSL